MTNRFTGPVVVHCHLSYHADGDLIMNGEIVNQVIFAQSNKQSLVADINTFFLQQLIVIKNAPVFLERFYPCFDLSFIF